jgi:hypothetical protein
MHAGESVSLSDGEQRKLLEFTIAKVNARAPVIAHVSDSGTGIAVARARHAQDVGAAAIVATTPYYWTPPQPMVIEHFAQIGSAVRVPFLIFYTPEEMGGTKLTTELVLKLIERLDNFAGLVDASLDWQFMVNIASNVQRVRPWFQMLSGSEYMISAGALGATSMFSSLSGIAPFLVRRLYDLCRSESGNRVGAASSRQEGRLRGAESRLARHGARLRRTAPSECSIERAGACRACRGSGRDRRAAFRAAWLVAARCRPKALRAGKRHSSPARHRASARRSPWRSPAMASTWRQRRRIPKDWPAS